MNALSPVAQLSNEKVSTAGILGVIPKCKVCFILAIFSSYK